MKEAGSIPDVPFATHGSGGNMKKVKMSQERYESQIPNEADRLPTNEN